jgi:protein TonB
VQQVVVQRRAARPAAEEKPAPEPRPLGVTPSSVAPGGGGPSVPLGSGDGQAGGRGTAPATGAKSAASTTRAQVAAPPTLRTRPRLLREHKVRYPEEARRQGIEGTVTLDVLVGEDGRVREAKVISGPGFGLNEAAQRALMRFEFAPAVYSDGRPRAHRIVYRYVFQID